MTGHDPSLRDLLKRHDPAAGDTGLTESERIRLRRAVVGAAGHPPLRTGWVRWMAVGALATAVAAAGLGLWRLRPAPPAPVAVAGPAARESLEVHIVTPGGTQIVWVLSPDFRL